MENEYLDILEEPRENPSIFKWIGALLAAFAAAVFISNVLIINARIPSASMEPTIMSGDRIIGNRLAYLRKTPNRGDVVIFRYPDDETVLFIKRVIGLPGETVVIENGKVSIDGRQLDEPYLLPVEDASEESMEFVVPVDSYFCLGDNREHSNDGRYWEHHYVSGKKILAKAVLAYLPKLKIIR